jgi:hypothetical protein
MKTETAGLISYRLELIATALKRRNILFESITRDEDGFYFIDDKMFVNCDHALEFVRNQK